MITQKKRFTIAEAAAFADLSENWVRKEIDYKVIEADIPSRLSFAELVYLYLVLRSPFALPAKVRNATYKRIVQALSQDELPEYIEVADPFYLRFSAKVTYLNDKVNRFLEWKKHLRADPDVMGGTTTFPNTRLTVRRIGGTLERYDYEEEVVAELLEDYPYLNAEDLEFAYIFVRAYPHIDELDGG